MSSKWMEAVLDAQPEFDTTGLPDRAAVEGAVGMPLLFTALYDRADAKRIEDAFIRNLGRILHGTLDDVPPDDIEEDDDEGQERKGDDVDEDHPLSHLRLIVFTHDLPGMARYWQRELGLPETGVTDNEVGAAIGKVFYWSDATGRDHSVVMFRLNVGYGLVGDEPMALASVAHEFAHLRIARIVHSQLGGFKEERLYPSEWGRVRRQMAAICLDELVAEERGGVFMPPDQAADHEALLVTIAKTCLAEIRERVAQYRHHGDITQVWGPAVDKVSWYTAHLGRIVGLSIRRELPESLLNALAEMSPAFAMHPVKMRAALAPIFHNELDLSWDAMRQAEDVIEEVFHAFGTIPKWDGENLSLDIPFWPGDHDRAVTEWKAQQLAGL